MNDMQIEVKNVKVSNHLSEETLAFTCSVYVDGKRAFEAENRGNGGANLYHPLYNKKTDTYSGHDKIEAAKEYAKTLPDYTSPTYGFTVPMSLDILIENLVENHQLNKTYKRKCKTKTLIQLPEHSFGEYIEFNNKFSPRIRTLVLDKYPNATFLNDRYN